MSAYRCNCGQEFPSHLARTAHAASCPSMADVFPPRGVPCREDCTVDCGRCKGRPIADLHRRIRRALAWGRDAHGGIPFDQKHAWQQGYAAARRLVLTELGTGVASAPSQPDASYASVTETAQSAPAPESAS